MMPASIFRTQDTVFSLFIGSSSKASHEITVMIFVKKYKEKILNENNPKYIFNDIKQINYKFIHCFLQRFLSTNSFYGLLISQKTCMKHRIF